MESYKNKRLAKNTIYLYIRTLLAVCINLYTSRLVLEYLGVEDYGVYNVVGGIVALMMFVYTAMSGETLYFITFCSGGDNLRDLKTTYLGVSFFAGFSIVEFLKMLRRVSKIMFECNPKSA